MNSAREKQKRGRGNSGSHASSRIQCCNCKRKNRAAYLEIAVYKSALMEVDDSFSDRFDRCSCFLFGITFLFHNAVKEFSTQQQLEHEIQMRFVLKVVVELNNIRMITALEDENLGANSRKSSIFNS